MNEIVINVQDAHSHLYGYHLRMRVSEKQISSSKRKHENQREVLTEVAIASSR